jgi:DNA helicase-2/ATP-dependent DNA helicase PcrA
MNLNDNQLKAVQKLEGPLRIVAGPGSGKTRTIVSKIAYLIENGFARPEEILTITFTNKAANEIKDRVAKATSSNVYNIYTYHG